MRRFALLLLLILVACSGGDTPTPVPTAIRWQDVSQAFAAVSGEQWEEYKTSITGKQTELLTGRVIKVAITELEGQEYYVIQLDMDGNQTVDVAIATANATALLLTRDQQLSVQSTIYSVEMNPNGGPYLLFFEPDFTGP